MRTVRTELSAKPSSASKRQSSQISGCATVPPASSRGPVTLAPRSRTPAALPGSAREILRALRGEVAVQQAGGLADLDQVPVGVAQVAADLRAAVDRRRHELCPLRLPVLVAGLDVRDPQVHEDR